MSCIKNNMYIRECPQPVHDFGHAYIHIDEHTKVQLTICEIYIPALQRWDYLAIGPLLGTSCKGPRKFTHLYNKENVVRKIGHSRKSDIQYWMMRFSQSRVAAS